MVIVASIVEIISAATLGKLTVVNNDDGYDVVSECRAATALTPLTCSVIF